MIKGIFGPMYASKSTELFKYIEKGVYSKKKIILIRPLKDNRSYFAHSYCDNAMQKLIEERKVDVFCIRDVTENIVKQANEYDIVAVDEYFMIENMLQLVMNISPRIDCYIAGLLADSDCNLFEQTKIILPYCDEIVKLNAVCQECGESANYSYHKGNKTSQIEVGDTKYECLCRKCFLEKTLGKGKYLTI